MKKLISLLLTLVMVFSLAVPALAAEPTITGNSNTDDPAKGNVTANFNPDIAITGISVVGETVSYDSETSTYTVVIPAEEETLYYTVVIEGTNLNYIPEDDTNYRIIIPEEDEVGTIASYVREILNYYNQETGRIEISYVISSALDGQYWNLHYSNDGENYSDYVYINFKQAYAINVADNIVGGSVNVGVDNSKTSAVEGETVELKVLAAEGYELDELTVKYTDDEDNEQEVVVDEEHQFVMPAYPVTVNATFKAATKTYTVTISANEGGDVSIQDAKDAYHHYDDVTLNIAPAEGYELDTLTITYEDENGVVQQLHYTDSYTFVMPAADVTVTATFKAVYGININVTGEGSVTADPSTAAAGEEVILTITPEDGYALYYLEVDYNPVAVNGNTYTFTMPQGPVYVRASFERTGKALETLYVKNTGSWETIYVYFYTDSGLYSLDYANLTIVGSETDIYYTTAIPEFAYKVQFVYDGEFSEYINLPTDGILNQYNPDTNTWTTFVPTERPTISADIVWGSMSFTYTDENGWANNSTAEDAGTVTVTNTGASSISATVEYKQAEGYEAIHGYFDEESATASAELATTNASKTFTLTLSGKPEKAMKEVTKIGEVTVTIE